MHTLTLILDKPSLQSFSKRILWGFATMAFWALWFYLWLPLITLVAWLFGIYTGHREMILLQGYKQAIEMGLYYLLIASLLGSILIAWALIQWFRFHNKERRKPRPNVDTAVLAAYHNLDFKSLWEWQAVQRLIAYYDEHGRLVKAEIMPKQTQFSVEREISHRSKLTYIPA